MDSALIPRDFARKLQLVHESESLEVLFSRLSALECPRRQLIRSLIVTSQYRLTEHFPSAPRTAYKLSHLRGENRLALFSLEHHYGRSARGSLKGTFFAIQLELPYTYLLLTVSGWPFWSRAFLPFIKRSHPKIVRLFMSQGELYNLLKNTREARKELSIRILKVSSRRRLTLKGARRRFETDIRWTDRPLEAVFRQAAEENIWFKSVMFELVRSEAGQFESVGIEASVSKYGSVFCNCFFGGFLKTAVLPMAELASEKLKFFTGRERRKTPELAPRPIVISFPTEVFRSSDDARRFVAVMAKMKNASCSILHGNPYVHLSLVDNLDGSSAQLWVLKADELTLVPQIKTSEAALKRIVNHVFEEWGEGNVREARG